MRVIPGEDEFSFAYDDCGKKVSAGREEEFGNLFLWGTLLAVML